MENYEQLQARFAREFGHQEGIRLFFAPGRVNLIGEHTDYNGGYVLPAALTYGTWALASPREDGVYRFRSVNFPGQAECRTDEVVYDQADGWANYPKGVLKEFLDKGEFSSLLTGADLLFYGNIPQGAGLSSSASIEMATAVAIAGLSSIPLPIVELVKMAQRAENQFVGVNCGIMDQFVVGMGTADHAVMLKCDTLAYSYIPFRIHGCKLVITNSNKRRSLMDSHYNQRRQECEEGLRHIQRHFPHASSLGELTYPEWEHVRGKLDDEVIVKRVEHVVGENARVLAAADCLKAGDLRQFGQLMRQSHASLRDLYEVTGAELDALYEAASRAEGCIGTRMTAPGSADAASVWSRPRQWSRSCGKQRNTTRGRRV